MWAPTMGGSAARYRVYMGIGGRTKPTEHPSKPRNKAH